jgi:hypothetical protein
MACGMRVQSLVLWQPVLDLGTLYDHTPQLAALTVVGVLEAWCLCACVALALVIATHRL